MKLPRLHCCHDCARDFSARAIIRKGLPVVGLLLVTVALAQTPAENSLRLTEIERRIQPVDSLVVGLARVEAKVDALVEARKSDTTERREMEAGIFLLIAGKLLDAFGVTVKKK